MAGPNVLLLPLKFYSTGVISSILSAIILGFITYKTCKLTYITSYLHEIEYITTVKRVLGTKWMTFYFFTSIFMVWLAAIIFFLTLSDAIYSGICFASGFNCPEKSTITFNEFSYQYTGIILLVLLCWTFFVERLGKILDATSIGSWSILVNSLFVFYQGIKAMTSDGFKIAFFEDKDHEHEALALFTNNGIVDTIGVFAMGFTIHMVAMPILRKNKNTANNVRDIRISYILTGIFYIMSGTLGTMGIYRNPNASKADTFLSKDLYEREPGTPDFYFVTISQFVAAF